ncbi:hypothetical protein O1L55_40900 [Streptomyces albulus]|nr:hypothetical protein [Streptomyces noursei]
MSITIDCGTEAAVDLLTGADRRRHCLDQLAQGIDARRSQRLPPHPATISEAADRSHPQLPASPPLSAIGQQAQRPDIANDLCKRAVAAEERWAERLPQLPGAAASLPHDLLDTSNALVLRRIVAAHGWPGIRLAGAEGADAALRIALRISNDGPFVRLLLRLLGEAAQQGDATWTQWAHLYDRHCVLEGLPQAYGTQYRTISGQAKLHPVADAAELAARRQQVGLPPSPEAPVGRDDQQHSSTPGKPA